MRTNLRTSIDNKFIFELYYLSYHTQCILSKIVTDFIYGDEPLDFLYLEENIFGVWPEEIVLNAIEELSENDIMQINICDCEDCDGEEEILFNPKFIKYACPYIECCQCCNPTPNFNVIYN